MKLTAILATAFAGVFGFLYILQINALTEQAYRMEQYETTKQHLADQNKTLETSANRILSMKDLAEVANLMDFERAGSISYVKMAEPAVATTNTR